MSSKRIRRLLKAVEELKPTHFPEQFKKENGDIFGLIEGEWEKLKPNDVLRLKNAYKKLDKELTERFHKNREVENLDIEVQIIDDDTKIAEPLIDFEDGYCLFENGFQHVLTVE